MPLVSHRMIFLRHGETPYNEQGRLQGQTDIALSAKGREQAESVGRYLRHKYAREIAAIPSPENFIASPLVRTQETMQLARRALGFADDAYVLEPRLKEIGFGDWEGLTWAEVEARDPSGFRARKADKWNFAPRGGESYAMLIERVRPWLAGLRQETFVAAHGGVAKVLMTLIGGVAPEIAMDAKIWQGRALIFEQNRFFWRG